jgi:hypothetical protein
MTVARYLHWLPQYCRATPVECFPLLGKLASSIIQASIAPWLSILGSTISQILAKTFSCDYAATPIKCNSFWCRARTPGLRRPGRRRLHALPLARKHLAHAVVAQRHGQLRQPRPRHGYKSRLSRARVSESNRKPSSSRGNLRQYSQGRSPATFRLSESRGYFTSAPRSRPWSSELPVTPSRCISAFLVIAAVLAIAVSLARSTTSVQTGTRRLCSTRPPMSC